MKIKMERIYIICIKNKSHSIENDFFYIFSHNLTIIITYFIDILNSEKEVINRKKVKIKSIM